MMHGSGQVLYSLYNYILKHNFAASQNDKDETGEMESKQ